MRHAYLLIPVSLLLLSGCILNPFRSDLDRLETRAAALDHRIVTLEVQRGVVVGSLDLVGSTATAIAYSAPVDSAARAAGAAATAPFAWWDSRKAFAKLARGVVNTLTGWVEVPRRAYETTRTSGPMTGLTWGVLRGLGHGFVRTAGGAYEVITFPFPAPAGYRSIIQPEFVFSY